MFPSLYHRPVLSTPVCVRLR